jgi:outer membrane protein assembly factor BamA
MDDETVIDAMFAMQMGSEDDGESTVTLVDFPGDDNDFIVNDIDFERTGFMFGARAFRAMREDLTIIPVFMFSSYTDTYGDTDREYKETAFAGGLGFDYTINEDNDLYLFASFQQEKDENTYEVVDETETDTNTYTAMPGIGVGVEHELTDMFTMRMGASKNWMKEKAENQTGDETTTNEYKYYPWQFTFGMGIAMGDWVIDLALNQQWLYSAGYWFHGYDSGSSPVAQIEAKLWF